MGRPTYQVDAYRRSLTTRVLSSEGGAVRCEDTIFHPQGGGQPGDSGSISADGGRWTVASTDEDDRGPIHRLSEPAPSPPVPGATVRLEIDWPRRYRFMRYHTALHLLSGVVFQRFGSGITGNQIAEDRARMDFSLPDFGRPLAEELIGATNALVARSLPVAVRFVTAEESAGRPELVRVASARPASGSETRLIDIVGFDVQADGGTHVRSTAEVGVVALDRIENKGARNKRLYLTVDARDPPEVP